MIKATKNTLATTKQCLASFWETLLMFSSEIKFNIYNSITCDLNVSHCFTKIELKQLLSFSVLFLLLLLLLSGSMTNKSVQDKGNELF